MPNQLITKIQRLLPEVTLTPGSQFYWSPETNEIFYQPDLTSQQARWSLLHETGHAVLAHRTYSADFELVKLEVAAWEQARLLAPDFGICLSEEHIQDCLDTYRDWLYKRSICPTCSTKCLQQQDFVHYRCFNCHTIWRVSPSRFCRTYRSTKNVTTSPLSVFQESLQGN